MRRNILFVFIFFTCSLLSAAEWSWETKGFPFQRVRIGEEGEWREVPPYIESCVSLDSPLGTTLYVQWAAIDGAWLEDLTEAIEETEDFPVISAADYVEIKRESREIKPKERINRFDENLCFSIGYESRLIGIYRNSIASPSSFGFPRISLPDAVTLDLRGEVSYKINSWSLAFCLGFREMIEPSPEWPSLLDSNKGELLYSSNPYVGLGFVYSWEKLKLEGAIEVGYSLLSQAFADNAHTGDILDIGMGRHSTAYTFVGVIGVAIPIKEKAALSIKERVLCYSPSEYNHVETLVGLNINI